MGSGARIQITAHVEIEWLSGRSAPAVCPNCGMQGTVEQILFIEYSPPVPDKVQHRFTMQICPECSVRFVNNPKMMEYDTDRLMRNGEQAYHVQVGAGVWPITGQLTRIDKPPGARVLEIGGAFGFGLDFCIRARGWEGIGFDPSPFAAEGMKELGLPIQRRYFTAEDLAAGPWDVVIATELIEHVAQPPELLGLLRAALGETGLLMLSTPDGELLSPELPPEMMMPLLSPGSHSVLQTAASLEIVLRRAGFAEVRILRDGMSLIAYASASPFTLIDDHAARRAMYRTYLVERAALSELTSDLRFGTAGRGIFESVNDGDWAAAEAAWTALLPAAKARFGLDLETMTALPPGAADINLRGLAKLMPLGLGMILFGRANYLLQAGRARLEIEPVLRLAAAATQALIHSLNKYSLVDGLSLDIARELKTELLLCDAAAGRPRCVDGFVALGSEVTSWRGFIELVNAGHISLAVALRAALPPMPGAEIPHGLKRNVLLSLANFYLAPDQDPAAAFAVALALREMGENADAVLLGAFTRLVNAARFDEAERAAEAYAITTLAAAGAQETGRDARLAYLILDLHRGRIEAVAQGLELLRAENAEPALLAKFQAEIFVRAVNAGDYALANSLGRDEAIEHSLAYCPRALAEDAVAARILLELQDGGNRQKLPYWLDRAAERGLASERVLELGYAAFTTAVNAADFPLARALLPRIEPEIIKLRQPFSAAERNALFAAGICFLQEERDWRRAAACFARLRDGLVKSRPAGEAPEDLFWPALRGEVMVLHRLKRADEAGLLLRDMLAAYPGAPEDLLALAPEPARR